MKGGVPCVDTAGRATLCTLSPFRSTMRAASEPASGCLRATKHRGQAHRCSAWSLPTNTQLVTVQHMTGRLGSMWHWIVVVTLPSPLQSPMSGTSCKPASLTQHICSDAQSMCASPASGTHWVVFSAQQGRSLFLAPFPHNPHLCNTCLVLMSPTCQMRQLLSPKRASWETPPPGPPAALS